MSVYSDLLLGNVDFDSQPLNVNLSATEQLACVQIVIVADTVDEPDELFLILLTTSTPDVTLLVPVSAEVIISEMGKLITLYV